MEIQWTPVLEMKIRDILRNHRAADSVLATKQPHPELFRQAVKEEELLEQTALAQIKTLLQNF